MPHVHMYLATLNKYEIVNLETTTVVYLSCARLAFQDTLYVVDLDLQLENVLSRFPAEKPSFVTGCCNIHRVGNDPSQRQRHRFAHASVKRRETQIHTRHLAAGISQLKRLDSTLSEGKGKQQQLKPSPNGEEEST
jgi:hypothetical protein